MIATTLAPPAFAEPKVALSSTSAKPGDAILVTVTGADAAPRGKVGTTPLEFFASATGYRAVFAVPLDSSAGKLVVQIDGAPKKPEVAVSTHVFPDASVVVEEEYANPGKVERAQIDADNQAIIGSFDQAKGAPQFTARFLKPAGRITSGFGEWRTFNDGHRSQHLGLDVTARHGSKVRAINAGTVVLVRDCFLAGTVVVIAHGAGIASAYYHLSKTDVVEGDTVKRGEVVGRAGKTGRATGSHLHLAVRVPGGWVDPISFFQLRLAPARDVTATATP